MEVAPERWRENRLAEDPEPEVEDPAPEVEDPAPEVEDPAPGPVLRSSCARVPAPFPSVGALTHLGDAYSRLDAGRPRLVSIELGAIDSRSWDAPPEAYGTRDPR